MVERLSLAVRPIAHTISHEALSPVLTTGDTMIATYTNHMRRRALAQGTIDKRVRALMLLHEEAGPLLELGAEDIERFLDARRGRTGDELDPRTTSVPRSQGSVSRIEVVGASKPHGLHPGARAEVSSVFAR